MKSRKSLPYIIAAVLIVGIGCYLFFLSSGRHLTLKSQSPEVDSVVAPGGEHPTSLPDSYKSQADTTKKMESFNPTEEDSLVVSKKPLHYNHHKIAKSKIDSLKNILDTSVLITKFGDTVSKNTSSIKSPQKDLKYGILGYSYPPTITVGNSKTIHAFISIIFPENKVRDTLVKIVLSDDQSQKGDSIVIVKPIRIYKEVTMTLDCMDTILRVTAIHPSATQEIDTLHGNKWSWEIYAKTADHPSSKLKLKITTTGPSSYDEKTLTIDIKVEPHVVRKVYDYLLDNPKVLISSILIPVIGFFGARYFNRKKK